MSVSSCSYGWGGKKQTPPQLLTPVLLFTYLSVLYLDLDPPSIHKKLQKFRKKQWLYNGIPDFPGGGGSR